MVYINEVMKFEFW